MSQHNGEPDIAIMELLFPGTLVPWNFRPLEVSFPRAKVTWNFRSLTLIIIIYDSNHVCSRPMSASESVLRYKSSVIHEHGSLIG